MTDDFELTQPDLDPDFLAYLMAASEPFEPLRADEITVQRWAEIRKISNETARTQLKQLCEQGKLTRRKLSNSGGGQWAYGRPK